MSVYKYSKTVKGHTGSFKLGCHFQNSENFGEISINTLVTGDCGYCFVDFSDSRIAKAGIGEAMAKCLGGDCMSIENLLHFLVLSDVTVVLGISTRLSLG